MIEQPADPQTSMREANQHYQQDTSLEGRSDESGDKFEAMAEHQQQGAVGGGHASRTHGNH